ncbi:MbtH family protein [Tatumella saanichensis]|uniref:MbtH family protein n=1 Tax=Tatumella saanichensis TaxID=480813 RepID=UPI0004A3D5C3|nr:MbtH family NRPS accessory protein [Tatumella saanichensis]
MELLHPFDQPQMTGYVLQNPQGHYSLWPENVALPMGWQPVFGPQSNTDCLEWLERHWPDIRPAAT